MLLPGALIAEQPTSSGLNVARILPEEEEYDVRSYVLQVSNCRRANAKCLALKLGRSVTGEDVIETLGELFPGAGRTAAHPVEQWPGFIYCTSQRWLVQ